MVKLLGLFNSLRGHSEIKWNAAAMSLTDNKAQQNYSDIRLKGQGFQSKLWVDIVLGWLCAGNQR